MNKLASLVLLGCIALTGCDDAEQAKKDASEAKEEVKQALNDAWSDVKDATNEFNDDSLQELLEESKKMGSQIFYS